MEVKWTGFFYFNKEKLAAEGYDNQKKVIAFFQTKAAEKGIDGNFSASSYFGNAFTSVYAEGTDDSYDKVRWLRFLEELSEYLHKADVYFDANKYPWKYVFDSDSVGWKGVAGETVYADELSSFACQTIWDILGFLPFTVSSGDIAYAIEQAGLSSRNIEALIEEARKRDDDSTKEIVSFFEVKEGE